MKFPGDPRRQAMLVAGLIWAIDAPLILAPSLLAGAMNLGAVAQAATIVAGGWLLCLGLYEIITRLGSDSAGFMGGAGAVAAASILLGLADALVVRMLGVAGLSPAVSGADLLSRGISNTIFVAWMFVLFAAIVLLLASNRRIAEREGALARAESQAARANAAATAARLAALRYQLNPHFLFNTLNAVSSAVVTRRNDEAEFMLTRLAEFLRATLSGDPSAEVRLEDELGTVEAYLEIESERFRQRLRTQIDCPEALRSALAPSFFLQPLVENAVKHGVSRSRSRVLLRVEVSSEEDDLVVRVEDDARPMQSDMPTPGGGIGLAAVRERLQVLYGERGVLQAEKLAVGFRVTVRAPLRFGSAACEAA